jgi:TRAP transporter TAXI family solute receptor
MDSISRRAAIQLGLAGLSDTLLGTKAWATPQQIGILTGPATGSYYSLGKIVAAGLTTQDLLVSAISSNGAFSNLDHVGAPFADTALSQADLAFWAYTGTELFRSKRTDLRLIANCYTETVHILCQNALNLADVSGLKGRKIGVYASNDSEFRNATLILAAHGLKPVDVDLQALAPNICIQQFTSGNIDAMFITAAQRAATVIALASSGVVFGLVPVDSGARDQLIAAYPYFSHDDIGANTYLSYPNVATVGIGCQWLTTKDRSDDTVFALTAGLWSDLTHQELLASFASAQLVVKGRATEGTNGVPLHPGALRFYRQEGIAN